MGGRVAGDDPGYTFALCRVTYEDVDPGDVQAILEGKTRRRVLTPTEDKIVLPSASTIIGEVLAKPPSAMAWWGYRVALGAVAATGATGENGEELEEVLKELGGATPNTSLEDAGGRGDAAHESLEFLAAGDRESAESNASRELATEGTEYSRAVIDWWDTQIQPYIDSGEIVEVLSEVKVWSLEDGYAGTFDLALHWVRLDDDGEVFDDLGWEVGDLKTHKPASGFTKPGKGPAYISDVVQIRAYRKAALESKGMASFRQRVIVARDKAYRGQRWLEDYREVPYEFFRQLRQAYDHRLAFEGGE